MLLLSRNGTFMFYYYAKQQGSILELLHSFLEPVSCKENPFACGSSHSQRDRTKILLPNSRMYQNGKITYYMKQITFDYSANVLSFRNLDCLLSKIFCSPHVFSFLETLGLGMKIVIIICFSFRHGINMLHIVCYTHHHAQQA